MTSNAVHAVDIPGARSVDAGDARSDTHARTIVDRGIALQLSSNTMAAFEYLRSRDIGAAVIERVLFDTLRRRFGT